MSSPVAELVGEFDHGLEGGRWSPDGEVLALFTYVDDDDDDYEDDEYHDDDVDENKGSDDGKSGGGVGRKRPVLMTMNARFEVLSEVSVEPNVTSHPHPPRHHHRRGTYLYHGVPTEPLSSYQQST